VQRRPNGRVVRALGIGILIFGVIHVPLPQADFHNIRHHDGPGELCPFHDHLLRWHPSATSAADVSILHWHWFIPQRELGDHQERPGETNRGPLSVPLLHAHLPNALLPDWPGELVTSLDGRSRLAGQVTLAFLTSSSPLHSNELAALDPSSRRSCSLSYECCGGLRAERSAMFQRWNC
jgi:hypothetical protein